MKRPNLEAMTRPWSVESHLIAQLVQALERIAGDATPFDYSYDYGAREAAVALDRAEAYARDARKESAAAP